MQKELLIITTAIQEQYNLDKTEVKELLPIIISINSTRLANTFADEFRLNRDELRLFIQKVKLKNNIY